MGHRDGRMTRAAVAPKAVILGLATFQFGWALVAYLRMSEESYYIDDLPLNLFVAFTLLMASASLCVGRTWSNLLAISLPSPLPLVHIFIFWASAHRCGAALFSIAHVRFWIADSLSRMPAIIWLSSALSCAILSLAAISALRQPSKLQAHSRELTPRALRDENKLLQEIQNLSVLADERRGNSLARAREKL